MTTPAPTPTLAHCQSLDAADPLRSLKAQFELPQGLIYLDGNSLGVLPKTTPARVAQVVTQEWGVGLIRSWNQAGWFDMPQRLGDKLAPLLGARPGETVVNDCTSINLYKVLAAAIGIAQAKNPEAKLVLSERSNFPTDLYMAQSLCAQHGYTLELVEADELDSRLTANQPRVAVLMLTQVNYRTGAMHDLAARTHTAHAAGALTVWDLAHSAGAVPVDLHGANADFAVGCGYKYLNGGPGAPAFCWVHPRHAEQFVQPLAGWWGHAAPFAFTPDYQPAAGVARYLCGTQPILSMAAFECGLDTVLAANACGGMAALRAKSLALTDLFIQLVESRCAGHGLALVTPRAHAQRGSQVCFSRTQGGHAIMQALIARGVIGDFRAGDPPILRFGFTPLYTGFAEVWQAAQHLFEVLSTREFEQARFTLVGAVT